MASSWRFPTTLPRSKWSVRWKKRASPCSTMGAGFLSPTSRWRCIPEMLTSIEAYFDGVCEPRNPGGHAAYGALIKVHGQVFWQEGKYIGVGPHMTNNIAEYSGAIAVLEALQRIPGTAI